MLRKKSFILVLIISTMALLCSACALQTNHQVDKIKTVVIDEQVVGSNVEPEVDINLLKEKYEYIGSYCEGLACVKENQDGLYGYIDIYGNVAIDFQFRMAGDFSCGRARVYQDDLWGYIDKSGNIKIEPQFDLAGDFQNGKAYVKKDLNYYYIDVEGEFINMNKK